VTRAESRRALLIAAVVLIALLALVDVLRPNSALRRFFGGDPATRQQEYINTLRRRGIPVPDHVSLRPPLDVSHDRSMTLG